MNKPDDVTEHKLLKLESDLESQTNKLSLPQPSNSLCSNKDVDVKSDLCYFGGIASLLVGLLCLFQHVKIGTGFFSALGLGGQGFGLLMIPLLIGIGWIMYDSKNRIAWAVLTGSCALILFSILSGLIMSFPTTSLLGLIMMLIPFALGGSLLLKAAGGPEGVRTKLQKEGLIK